MSNAPGKPPEESHESSGQHSAEHAAGKSPGKGRFPQTDWSDLARIAQAGGAGPALPLDRLAAKYWSPICQYLVFKGYDAARAQDLAQDFFLHAMTTGLFARADRTRGRFRSLLLTALANFAANEWRRDSALQRRPEGGFASLDEMVDDDYVTPQALRHEDTPERQFHQAWIRTVLHNVLGELQAQLTASGRATHYALFHARVVAPQLEGLVPPPLQEQARELGLDYKDAANRIVTAKRAFVRLLAEELRSYAGSEAELADDEQQVHRLLSW